MGTTNCAESADPLPEPNPNDHTDLFSTLFLTDSQCDFGHPAPKLKFGDSLHDPNPDDHTDLFSTPISTDLPCNSEPRKEFHSALRRKCHTMSHPDTPKTDTLTPQSGLKEGLLQKSPEIGDY